MRTSLFILFLFSIQFSYAQTKRVLFLGNSYTSVNNLPQLVADVALSVGDTLIVDSNTPGGYTLEGHTTNATTESKIMEGNWDFIVLQEQSQRPSFPLAQVENEVFPYAEQMNTMINESNTCCETVFYMTWGREEGDAGNCEFWPPICTYEGMDDLLTERYMTMGADNDAIVSPVGALWRYIRENHPEIDLFASDGSHPSNAGSYAAACSFYSVILRKDPESITYNYSLDSLEAITIREAAKTIVFDSLSQWYVGDYDLSSDFTMDFVDYGGSGPANIQFNNLSLNATGQFWEFDNGDGLDPTSNPYIEGFIGYHDVVLTSFNACDTVSSTQLLIVDPLNINGYNQLENFKIFPNPATDFIHFELPSLTDDIEIKLFDLNGKLVANNTCSTRSNSLMTIDLSLFSEGIYYYQLWNKNIEISSGKFEVQR